MRRQHVVAFSFILLFATFTADCQEQHDHGAVATITTTTPNVPHSGQMISFKSAPGSGSGYLATPTTRGKHPGIIVIQEWWGLNDWVKEQADRLASQGYVALA